ncbi:MAG: prepilin peptidase [Thermoguttaceae bacterium]
MIGAVLLLALLAVATATDLARHKIYNWNTYPGTLAAWILNAAGMLWLRVAGSEGEPRLRELGWIGLKDSLWGFLACGLLVLLCYLVFKVGGGDVKLIAMMGALLGFQRGVMAMLWTFVIAGCAGLIVLVWRVGPGGLLAWAWRQLLWLLRLGRPSPLTPEERALLQPPLYLAPSALAAAVIVQFQLVERYM